MKKQAFAAVVLGALLALGGCASSLTGDVYSREDARAPQTVRQGTVESVRLVQIEGTKTVIGPAAGAAIGGVAGSTVGGGRGSTIAAIVGALAGGVAGRRPRRVLPGPRVWKLPSMKMVAILEPTCRKPWME